MESGGLTFWRRRYLLRHYRRFDDATLAARAGVSQTRAAEFLDRMSHPFPRRPEAHQLSRQGQPAPDARSRRRSAGLGRVIRLMAGARFGTLLTTLFVIRNARH